MSDLRLFDHREAVCIADIQNRDKTKHKTKRKNKDKQNVV